MIIFQTLPPVVRHFPGSSENSSPVVASGACEAPRCKNRPRWSYYSHPCPTTLAIHGLECSRCLSFLKESSYLNKSSGLKMLFFSNKEKMQLVYLPTNSSKVIQFLFEEPLHPEKNTWHVSHGQQDPLCQQKCSVPRSGPPLPNDLPENPRNRAFCWGSHKGGKGYLPWNWVTLAFAPSWLNWEPPPAGVERVWPLGVESWFGGFLDSAKKPP